MKNRANKPTRKKRYCASARQTSASDAARACIFAGVLGLCSFAQAESISHCTEAKPYIFGQDYQSGDVVKKHQEFYVCINEGLCGSVSSTRYQPGTGHQWEVAWYNLDCKKHASNPEQTMAKK